MCGIVGALPRRLTYAIGHVSMWLAWRLMGQTRAAIADNLQAIFPNEPAAARERRALGHAARLRTRRGGLPAGPSVRPTTPRRQLFDFTPEHARLFETLLAQGQGHLLVSGHYGNWEIGSVLMRVFNLPLTIVAMAEANPEVNRRRRELRDRLGADTIEVRKSIDAALQIRRRLGDNRIVAMLMDRHFGRDRVAVTLAGRRAWFLKTPALMGLLSGAPLVPCFIERTGPERFSAIPGEPIVVAREPSSRGSNTAGGAAVRRSAERAASPASQLLVPLLPLLGFSAGRLRPSRQCPVRVIR